MDLDDLRASLPQDILERACRGLARATLRARRSLVRAKAEGRAGEDASVCRTCLFCEVLLDLDPGLAQARLALARHLVD